MEYKTYFGQDEQMSVTNLGFHVFSLENQWLIHLADDRDQVLYHEAGSDGEYIYSYTAAKKTDKDVELQVENPYGSGTIVVDGVPRQTHQIIKYIWLAMASNNYFAKNRHRKNMIPLSHSVDIDQEPIDIDLDLQESNLSLPKKIDFWGGSGPEKWINANYTIIKVEDFIGMQIPVEWSYTTYGRPVDPDDLKSKGPIRVSVKGAVAKLESIMEIDPKPYIPGPIIIDDYRYNELNPPVELVQYTVREDSWPSFKNSTAYAMYLSSVGMDDLTVSEEKTGLI